MREPISAAVARVTDAIHALIRDRGGSSDPASVRGIERLTSEFEGLSDLMHMKTAGIRSNARLFFSDRRHHQYDMPSTPGVDRIRSFILADLQGVEMIAARLDRGTDGSGDTELPRL